VASVPSTRMTVYSAPLELHPPEDLSGEYD
jgi:hypothetical protein